MSKRPRHADFCEREVSTALGKNKLNSLYIVDIKDGEN